MQSPCLCPVSVYVAHMCVVPISPCESLNYPETLPARRPPLDGVSGASRSVN